MMIRMALASLAIVSSMLVEARRAAANERAQQARGGIEPPGDVYQTMRVAYPVAFLAMVVEGLVRGGPSGAVFLTGVAVFATAKALKWWAILSLGPCWTFRVIVVPGAPLVARGPYRVIPHPNYVGVVGELAGTALMTGATICGPLGSLAFSALMFKRIRIEDRALRAAAR